MRDMLDGYEPYPLEAWRAQFGRIREDLDDALRIEAQLAAGGRSRAAADVPAVHLRFAGAVLDLRAISCSRSHARAASAQGAVHPHVATGAAGRTEQYGGALPGGEQRGRAAGGRASFRASTRGRTPGVCSCSRRRCWRSSITAHVMIRSNRAVFYRPRSVQRSQRTGAQTDHRSGGAVDQLSRELHDEFGQILTAIGAMFRRGKKGLPQDSPLLRQIAGDPRSGPGDHGQRSGAFRRPSTRRSSRLGGSRQTIDWYVPTFERQTGIVTVHYGRSGSRSRASATQRPSTFTVCFRKR